MLENFEKASIIIEESNDLTDLVNNRAKLLEPGGKRMLKERSDNSTPLIEDPSYFNPLILNKGHTLRGRDLLEIEEEVKNNCKERQVTVTIPLDALDVEYYHEN